MKYVAISDFKEWELAETIAVEYGFGFESQLYTKNRALGDKDLQQKFAISKEVDKHSYHGPFRELFHLCASNDEIEKAYDHYQRFYQIALDAGASHVVFHSGFVADCMTEEAWLEESKLFWTRFLQDKDNSIEIHIENVYEPDFRGINALIDFLDTPWMKICLDVGHANMSSTLPVEEWAAGLGRRIGSVHLHNNDGSGDQHLGLANGTIHMRKVLQTLESVAPEAVWVLETREKEASLQWLKEQQFI